MKILLVYPKYPDTFWSFKYALKFISKKASFPPLGLLTVAAMLPDRWEKKLVDMNVSSLTDEDITWADYVFISAMIVQKESAEEVIERYLEAIGGRQNLKKIQTMVITYSFLDSIDQDSLITRYFKSPHYIRQENTNTGISIATDGKRVWRITSGKWEARI